MLYSEKGEALGPSSLWGCASPMGSPWESKDGRVEPQHPRLHHGLGNATVMLRFWRCRMRHADDAEEEKPPLILILCPLWALHGWV